MQRHNGMIFTENDLPLFCVCFQRSVCFKPFGINIMSLKNPLAEQAGF